MTSPAPEPAPDSAPSRPDWLLGMDADPASTSSTRGEAPAGPPVLRVTPGSAPPQRLRPTIVPTPGPETSPAPPPPGNSTVVEGLVVPAAPAVKSLLGSRSEQMGLDEDSIRSAAEARRKLAAEGSTTPPAANDSAAATPVLRSTPTPGGSGPPPARAAAPPPGNGPLRAGSDDTAAAPRSGSGVWAAPSNSVPQLRAARNRPREVREDDAGWSTDDPPARNADAEPARPRPAAVTENAGPAPGDWEPAPQHAEKPAGAVPAWAMLAIPVLLALGGALIRGVFAPPEADSASIREIRDHATQMDGKVVHLGGKVGDVFQVGDGYAFYLLQGSDTIVVYSKLRKPRSGRRVSLYGSVSTGYLDGAARPSLFETQKP